MNVGTILLIVASLATLLVFHSLRATKISSAGGHVRALISNGRETQAVLEAMGFLVSVPFEWIRLPGSRQLAVAVIARNRELVELAIGVSVSIPIDACGSQALRSMQESLMGIESLVLHETVDKSTWNSAWLEVFKKRQVVRNGLLSASQD